MVTNVDKDKMDVEDLVKAIFSQVANLNYVSCMDTIRPMAWGECASWSAIGSRQARKPILLGYGAVVAVSDGDAEGVEVLEQGHDDFAGAVEVLAEFAGGGLGAFLLADEAANVFGCGIAGSFGNNDFRLELDGFS